MGYVLAFLGFSALIVLHEFGHFAAAKAVGMRVERFSLFFGPMLAKVRRGETEYGIAAIPLGGYVKITGMSPREELSDEVAPRAYWAQPVWKRVFVIGAGPAMNILVAFLILWGLAWANGWDSGQASHTIGAVGAGTPAAKVLRLGDQLVSVDGVTNPDQFSTVISSHRCTDDRSTVGCVAATPVQLVVRRGGRTLSLSLFPRFAAAVADSSARPRIGVAFDDAITHGGAIGAAGQSVDEMWDVTSETLSTVGQLFVSAKARKSISSSVGLYTVTSQAFSFNVGEAIGILGLISLSLAIINLFPFLPLDGGHIFWAVLERLRGGRVVSVTVMEQASIVGIALIGFVFIIGLQNDVHTLTHGGFHIH